VEHVQHMAGNMTKFGNASRKACGRMQDPVKAPQLLYLVVKQGVSSSDLVMM